VFLVLATFLTAAFLAAAFFATRRFFAFLAVFTALLNTGRNLHPLA